MEGDHPQRIEALKKRSEFFSPYNYGTLLTNLFDKVGVGLPIVVMVFDMQTLLIHKITDNCKDIWGYKKEEMEWMDISKLIHHDDLAKSIELADQSALSGIEITSYKNRHFNKAGKVVYLMWETVKTFNYLSLVFCWQITKDQFEDLEYK